MIPNYNRFFPQLISETGTKSSPRGGGSSFRKYSNDFNFFRSSSHPASNTNRNKQLNNAFSARKNRKFVLRPMVKKQTILNDIEKKKFNSFSKSSVDDDNSSSSRVSSVKDDHRIFNPIGYESHLVDSLEKDILQRNPNVPWSKVAGLGEAKAILQEAMVLPIIMPDFFKVRILCARKSIRF